MRFTNQTAAFSIFFVGCVYFPFQFCPAISSSVSETKLSAVKSFSSISQPFEIQKDHQELAKAILDDSSELLKQGMGTSLASEDINAGLNMNPIPGKRERRPGLDRKRGRFSFKPTISQPPSNEPRFDGSKYPKPEDFFAAFERHKIAIREWQKQTGYSVTDTHQNPSSRRPRKPGTPERKRGTYKHTYTDSYFTAGINLEISEKENPIPSEQSLERTTPADVSTADREVDELTVDTDKDLENILIDLLACNKDELKGDGAVKLLEERLQIKPIDVDKFTIPEIQDVREMRLKASGRNPSKRKSVLSDIQNMLEGIHNDEVRKHRQTPSPLTRKHISPKPSLDQFSFPDSNHLLPGDQQSSEVDLAKDLNLCSGSPVANDADKDIANTSTSNVGNGYEPSPLNSSVQKISRKDDSHSLSGIYRSHSTTPDRNADNCVDDGMTNRNSAMLEMNADMQTKGSEEDVSMSESEANRNTSRSENDADINEGTGRLDSLAVHASREYSRMNPITLEEENIPNQQDESSKSSNRTVDQCNAVDGSFEHAANIQKQGEVNDNTETTCGLQAENAQEVCNSSDEQTNKRRKRGGSRDSSMSKRSKRKSNDREVKQQMKTVTREGKICSRRKSLAAAGTKWESGVRRSTRIKSRPLEYWRGERFLFGRIHESLATVIGIKYASPEKSRTEKRALKVKSFVSDDYKELVELAALH